MRDSSWVNRRFRHTNELEGIAVRPSDENGGIEYHLPEKVGKRHAEPAHHYAEAYVDAYVAAAQIAVDRKGSLFRSLDRTRH